MGLKISELLRIYEHGDTATGWPGVRAEYPPKPGRRHSEADNMLYALRHMATTTIDLVPSAAVAATQHGLFQSQRVIADLDIEDLTAGDLRHVQQQMAASGLVRSTVNARMKRVRRWLRWARLYGYASPAVLEEMACVAPLRAGAVGVKHKAPVRSVDQERMELTAACAGFVLSRAIEVQARTAMRPGELVSMRICHLGPYRDPQDGGRIQHWLYQPGSHKTEHTGATRGVGLGPEAVLALRAVIEARFGQAELAGGVRMPRLGDMTDTRLIWPWGCGRSGVAPFSEEAAVKSYRDAVRRAARRAGVEPWAPNQIRHKAATFAHRQAGEEVAAQHLGHGDPRTTRRHYIDPASTFEGAHGAFVQEHG